MTVRIFKLKLIIFLSLLLSFSISATGRSDLLIEKYTSDKVKERLNAAKHIIANKNNSSDILLLALDHFDELQSKFGTDKYALKEALLALDILALSNKQVHLSALNKYLAQPHKKLKKSAIKAQRAIQASLNKITQAEQLRAQVKSPGRLFDFYFAYLFGPTKVFRHEGQYQLYNARLSKQKEVDDLTEYKFTHTTEGEIISQLSTGSLKEVKNVLQLIFYSGVDSPKISAIIARRLEFFLSKPLKEHGKVSIDELAWQTKALAASGDLSYMPLLSRVANYEHKKLAFHAAHAKVLLKAFNDFYSALEQTANIFTLSTEELCLLALKAPYLQVKNPALHYLVRSKYVGYDDEVSHLAYLSFKDEYPFIRRSPRHVKPAKHSILMIAKSGNESYYPVLKEAAETAPSAHVSQYADKFYAPIRRKEIWHSIKEVF